MHTQEGLRPIEQIKVGDYVLSKPESGQGEPSYKRVSRTFKYDDKEVWYVEYVILNEDYTKTRERDFFVATGNHPVRVKGFLSYKDRQFKLNELNIWRPVRDLIKVFYEYEGDAVLELQDGRLAVVNTSRVGGLLMRSDIPEYGVVGAGPVLEGDGGIAVLFNNGKLEITREDVEINLDDQGDSSDYPEGSVGNMNLGWPPLLRTVYNLEVEENHTYYVGEVGVLVHNTSGQLPQKSTEGRIEKPTHVKIAYLHSR
ncbi:MAG: hypothetical protein FJ190_05565 [Gammaproteobacteria bacterium]|nr:hypothetical protein [Gammaproteobacteria bacterium]